MLLRHVSFCVCWFACVAGMTLLGVLFGCWTSAFTGRTLTRSAVIVSAPHYAGWFASFSMTLCAYFCVRFYRFCRLNRAASVAADCFWRVVFLLNNSRILAAVCIRCLRRGCNSVLYRCAERDIPTPSGTLFTRIAGLLLLRIFAAGRHTYNDYCRLPLAPATTFCSK